MWANHACLVVKTFLFESDVFRGAIFPWKTSNKEIHLLEPGKQLFGTVIGTFEPKFENYSLDLFTHGTTNFNDNERATFQEVAPDGPNFVRI